MKTFGNKLVIILFCGSVVLAIPDSAVINDAKYADIVPQGLDPMDSVTYSLLIEHLKRPPSRNSINHPIENAYYIIDTHRRPDGTYLVPSNPSGPGPVAFPGYAQPPVQFSKTEYGVSAPPSDQNVASSVHEFQSLKQQFSGDVSQVSLTTTEPAPTHLTQEVQPPQVNSTADYGISPGAGKHQEVYHHTSTMSSVIESTTGKYEASITKGSPSPQNSLESEYQKHPGFPQLQTLSEQLKLLSHSLTQLQLLARPQGPYQREPESQPITNQSTQSSQNPQETIHVTSPPISSIESTTVHQPYEDNGTQTMQLPEDLGTHIMTLYKTNTRQNESSDSKVVPSIGSQDGIKLEHGIPSNLNEEMASLEESLRNEQYALTQKFNGSSSSSQQNVQEGVTDPSTNQQNSQLSPHPQDGPGFNVPMPPAAVDTINANNLNSEYNNNRPPYHHHSVSHKIPEQELSQAVAKEPESPHIPYHHPLQHEETPIIFKNKYFSVQSSPLAQSHYIRTGSNQQTTPNIVYNEMYRQPQQQIPIHAVQQAYLHHSHQISRTPTPNARVPVFSKNNGIQKAVEVLNNYSDTFIDNIIQTEQKHKEFKQTETNHFQTKLVDQRPGPTTTSYKGVQNPQTNHSPIFPKHSQVPVQIARPAHPPPNPTPTPVRHKQQAFEHIKPNNIYKPMKNEQHQSAQPSRSVIQTQQSNHYPVSEEILQLKPAYARVILRHGHQQIASHSQPSENIEPSTSVTNEYLFEQLPTRVPSRPPPHYYHSEKSTIKSNSVLKPQFSAPDMLFRSTEQIEQVLKSAVLPTPLELSSSQSAKYSTIFIRPQPQGTGVNGNNNQSWKLASAEVQSRRKSNRPLNYQVFQNFGKVF